MKLGRRSMLAVLGWLASPKGWAAGTPPGLRFPPLANPAQPEFAEFSRLCKAIADLPVIDVRFCQRVYRLILEEPWGPEHVAQVYARMQALDRSGQSILDPSYYSEAERWFVGHLLVTLYTGVYYHASGNQAAGYHEALMHQVVGKWRNAPTACGGTYGYWAKPPSGRGNG